MMKAAFKFAFLAAVVFALGQFFAEDAVAEVSTRT
jgi:hypothetical protein